MGQMALIRKKASEAVFFFGHLSDVKPTLTHETEDFNFFLSAFLSAGRSIIGFFYDMQNRNWFRGWKMSLTARDRELLNEMVRQRDREIHEGGADVVPEFEFVPVVKLEIDPCYEDSSPGLPCAPAGSVTRKRYYFWIDGKQLDVKFTCEHYLELLLKLVCDFEETLTMPD